MKIMVKLFNCWNKYQIRSYQRAKELVLEGGLLSYWRKLSVVAVTGFMSYLLPASLRSAT